MSTPRSSGEIKPSARPEPQRIGAERLPATARVYGTLSGWGAVLRRHWQLTVLAAAVVELLALLPFAIIDPLPFFGMPGALATAVSLATAIVLGPWPGGAVAFVGGIFFATTVAAGRHHYRLDATILTVILWILVALLAGIVSQHQRRRLAASIAEIDEHEEQLRLTLDAADTAVGLFLGSDLACAHANDRLRRLFARDDWEGRPLVDLIPQLDSAIIAALDSCARGERGRVRQNEVRLPVHERERVFTLSARCTQNDIATVFLTLADTTAAVRMRRSLEQLLDFSQQLSADAAPRAVAQAVCETAIDLFGCAGSSYWTVNDQLLSLLARAPRPATQTSWDLAEFPELTDVLRTRQIQVIDDAQKHYGLDAVSEASGVAGNDAQRYLMREGFRSMMWLPVAHGVHVDAVMFLGWLEKSPAISEETLGLVTRFAGEASAAIERSERLVARNEVEALFHSLEARLLPRFHLKTRDLDFDFRYRAGEQRMNIGGDFLGAIEQPDGTLALVIGDVSGHGPDAAAMGAMLRSSWRSLALAGIEPLMLVRNLDALMLRDRRGPEEFATICLVWVNADLRRVRIILAGHHRPLLLDRSDRRAEESAVSGDTARQRVSESPSTQTTSEVFVPYGPPLGILPPDEAAWQVSEIELPDHWALLLYTDGLVEGFAEPGARERFGLERLRAVVTRELDGDPGAALDRVLAVARRANGGAFADDVAMLLLQNRD
ncbi:MAG: SpoIIE family protein phosphatase [Thermoleophilia bacterium]